MSLEEDPPAPGVPQRPDRSWLAAGKRLEDGAGAVRSERGWRRRRGTGGHLVMRALLCAAPPLGGSPIALFFLSCHPPAAIVIPVPLVTPLGQCEWINRNVCHREDERSPAANGSTAMLQVWASLEWGGECENRQRHTLSPGDTPAEGMQMEFRRKKERRALRRRFRWTAGLGN